MSKYLRREGGREEGREGVRGKLLRTELDPFLPPSLPPFVPLNRKRAMPQDRKIGVEPSFSPQVRPSQIHERGQRDGGGGGLEELAEEGREGRREGKLGDWCSYVFPTCQPQSGKGRGGELNG